jgi:hypothetical protein
MKFNYKLDGSKNGQPVTLDVSCDGGRYNEQAHSLWQIQSFLGERAEFDVIDNIEYQGKTE